MEIVNKTGFEAEHFSTPNVAGAEATTIVVKGCWTIGKNGDLSLAQEQVPILLAPLYHGEPGLSTLRYDADSHPCKLGTDCILSGHARASGEATSAIDVVFAVGSVHRAARVFGKRRWLKRLIGAPSISYPEPFETIPLIWERSFGGADDSNPKPSRRELCRENPIGMGFMGRGMGFMGRDSRLDVESLALPHIENPADPIRAPRQRPEPWGFVPIPPAWQPRAGFAGTYDDNWRETRMPFPPADQDPRFYSSAPPGLCSARCLSGSEPVLVEGAGRSGRLSFDLPGTTPIVSVRRRKRSDELAVHLATVIVEPDEDRLILIWKAVVAPGEMGASPLAVTVE